MISVVIPTFDAGLSLSATLKSLERSRNNDLVQNVVISDSGSTDDTEKIARNNNCFFLRGAKGRGNQLKKGAKISSALIPCTPWLLFLHADTILQEGWEEEAARFMNLYPNKAAYFTFELNDASRKARLLEKLVSLRNRLFALPYGDQGLLIPRNIYDYYEGFDAVPLMEDVLLIRRLGRKILRRLGSRAVTSFARYQQGYGRRILRNFFCLTLFFCGISPARIAKIYG
jgi:glycosyltransferase involved in cell wall biosynthesis